MSGVYPAGSYEGTIRFEGRDRNFRTIADSEDIGIIIIHQEWPGAASVDCRKHFLGQETAKNGVSSTGLTHSPRTRKLLEKVGLSEHPNTLITNIGQASNSWWKLPRR